jgi:hypothetical protein
MRARQNRARSHTQRTPAGETALPQLIGNADLTEGRLPDRQRYDGILDLLQHAVVQHRLLAATVTPTDSGVNT